MRRKCPGGELLHARHDAGVIGHIAPGEIVLDRLRARRAAEGGICEDALQLGREDEPAVGKIGIEKRLHAQPVAGEEERLAVRIVERESEHAVQARKAVRPHCRQAARITSVSQSVRKT
jgi:hypothetical protein